MQQVKLGRRGPKVSEIGIGVWQASKDWGGKDEEIVRAIVRSHELGVSLVDTAEAYGAGHSESVVGRAIRQIGRESLVIATKVYGAHLGYEELQRACRASIERLGVREIDLYQVHWPDPWEQIPLRHTMRALEKLYSEGKIRAIGVSNFAVRDLIEARSYLSKTDVVSNQVRYNLLQRNIEEEVLPYCRKEGVGVLAYSPIAQGALTGKYGRARVPRGDVRDGNPLFARRNMAQIEKMIAILSSISERHGRTIAQLALNWLTKDPLVVPIPGAKTPQQAEENAGAARWRLSKSELEEIEMAYRKIKIDYFQTR